jgi:hypothetical protein
MIDAGRQKVRGAQAEPAAAAAAAAVAAAVVAAVLPCLDQVLTIT